MADLKISQLNNATTPLGGTEVFPLVQSGTTKKVAVSNFVQTAGAQTIAGSKTFSSLLTASAGISHGGNIIGTASDYYIGLNAVNNFLRFQAGTQRIHATNSITFMIDADNDSTAQVFAVRANGVDVNVFHVDEVGAAYVNNNVVITSDRHHQLRSYTVGTLPSAATAGQMIYVSDASGSPCMATSNGTVWKRCDDQSVTVS